MVAKKTMADIGSLLYCVLGFVFLFNGKKGFML